MVLGRDWLSRHRVTLDCYKKEVKLHRSGKLEVKFRGTFKAPEDYITNLKGATIVCQVEQVSVLA